MGNISADHLNSSGALKSSCVVTECQPIWLDKALLQKFKGHCLANNINVDEKLSTMLERNIIFLLNGR